MGLMIVIVGAGIATLLGLMEGISDLGDSAVKLNRTSLRRTTGFNNYRTGTSDWQKEKEGV
jgi:hypothetical protein